MAINITIDTAKLEQILREVPQKAEAALDVIAEEIVTDIKLEMQSSPPDASRTYQRGGRTHQASAPGNPPRPDYGALIGSIRSRKSGKLKREVMDGVEYGYYLETVGDRPWMRPVLMEYAQGKAGQILKEELQL